MALNKIGDDNLYIGSFLSLSNNLALRNANITHVVTVLRMRPDEKRFDSFEHLHIQVDDVSDEDLLQHFPETNAFISSGLKSGGGVLVHCAMGKSRSATVCIAYMLHRQPGALTPREALEMVRKARPICEPNDGFMDQLELYHKMGCPDNVSDHPQYQRWQYKRSVEESVACGRGPEMEEVRFEDEHQNDVGTGDKATEVKCRKCRRNLATLPFIIPHEQEKKSANVSSTSQCAHVFLHPLTWMRPSLFPSGENTPHPDGGNLFPEAPLSGRITCPNTACAANIGKFAWQGMRCSCGTWVVPAIALARARIDVIDASVKKGIIGGGAGIRLPPGMRMPAQDPNGGGRGSL